LKLNQLEIFCTIVDGGSFSKAAKTCRLSQPTLTEHIKSLESYLGIVLLDRLGREVVPTKAGEILYTYAKRMLGLKAEVEQKINSLKGDLKGSLIVGASTIPGEYILPPVLKAFRDEFPHIFIQLIISDTKLIIEDIIQNRIEMGIVGAKMESAKLEYHSFVKDELVLVVPSAFPWARKKSVAPDDLKNIPFVFREEGSGTGMVMKKALKDCGVDISDLNVVAILGSTTAVVQAISNEVGCSIISRKAAQDALAAGVMKSFPIQGITFDRDFYLVSRRGKSKSPLCEAFFNFLLAQ
jgi:DNA-binding transcriptional LysR family regulator